MPAFEADDPNLEQRLGLISGLAARADLNGKLGRAVKWVSKKDRWAVIMVDTGEKVLVRQECIDFTPVRPDGAEAPAMGLPIAAAATTAAEPALPPSAAVPVKQATGSPGHPVVGMQVTKADEPPIVKFFGDAFACLCTPALSLSNSALGSAFRTGGQSNAKHAPSALSAAVPVKEDVTEPSLIDHPHLDANISGWPSLTIAAYIGSTQDVSRLLAAGAPIDAMDPHGETALCKAVFGRGGIESSECVRLLLAAGADTAVIIRSGQSVLAAARRASNKSASVHLIAGVSDSATCEVCAEDVTTAMRVEMRSRAATSSCNHGRSVCFDCMRMHVHMEINGKGNVNEIRCPHNECGALLDASDVKHFATSDNFQRYDDVQTRRFLQSLPEFRWCAHPGCGSGQLTDGGEGENNFMRCVACQRPSCLVHRCPMHVGQSCAEYDQARHESEEVGLHQYLQSEQVRRCPNCQMGLEKSGGCDHYTCRREAGGCGHEFCWLCLAPYHGARGIFTIGNSAHQPTCLWYAADPSEQ